MSVFVPPNLSYSAPQLPISSEMDYVAFSPVSGHEFGPTDTVKINVQSPQSFLDPRRSYLKYDLQMTGGNTTSGNPLTVLGGTSVIKTFTTEISGLEIERIEDYNEYVSALYKRSPLTYQNVIKQLESYDSPTFLHSSGDIYTAGRSVYHSPRIAILETIDSKELCLPFIRGGINFSITLDTLNNVLAATNNQGDTSYKVSNVQFIACLITPPQEYLASFSASLARGSEAQIPLTLVKRHSFVPTASTNQTTQMHIGYMKSLRSVLGTCRLNTSRNAAAVDAFNNDTSNSLTAYRFNIGSKFYPKNYKFRCANAVATRQSPENIIQMLNSIDNTFISLDSSSHSANTDFAVFYNFAPESFGSGVPVTDGIVSVEMDYSGQPSASVWDMYFIFDGILKISALDVSLEVRSF